MILIHHELQLSDWPLILSNHGISYWPSSSRALLLLSLLQSNLSMWMLSIYTTLHRETTKINFGSAQFEPIIKYMTFMPSPGNPLSATVFVRNQPLDCGHLCTGVVISLVIGDRTHHVCCACGSTTQTRLHYITTHMADYWNQQRLKSADANI
jgi:hypothetical protein